LASCANSVRRVPRRLAYACVPRVSLRSACTLGHKVRRHAAPSIPRGSATGAFPCSRFRKAQDTQISLRCLTLMALARDAEWPTPRGVSTLYPRRPFRSASARRFPYAPTLQVSSINQQVTSSRMQNRLRTHVESPTRARLNCAEQPTSPRREAYATTLTRLRGLHIKS
jgi:hypothetical protein